MAGPTWRKASNGKILVRYGSIVISDNCCCDTCCGCSWLETYNRRDIENPGTARIKVEFSGALSGYAILHADNSGPDPGYCLRFVANTEDELANLVDDCLIGPFSVVEFYCQAGDTTMSELKLVLSGGSAGCGLSPWTQESASCGPPLSIVYSAFLVENIPGECAPCADGDPITATVTNFDAFP